MALDLDALDVDGLHGCAARAVAQERQQRVDGVVLALGVDGDGPVVGVAHPAQHAELAGAAHGGVAEADALDAAADGGTDRVGHRCSVPIAS
jgi:hypothetical protein